MKMTKNIWATLAVSTLVATVAIGCGSSSSSDDANPGPGPDGSAETGGETLTLFGLTDGTWCFDITAISNATDGCELDVAALVGKALPVKYTAATGVLSVGTEGSLGAGPITQNKGTLTREGDTSDGAQCTWHQVDTSMVELTAENQFTISVVEKETMFAAACNPIPAGGMCMSSWTWKMKINGAKKPEMKCE